MKAKTAPTVFSSLLVVDDSSVQRAHTVELCRNIGVPMIYEAGSGSEALELLTLLVLPPDVMIVDLEMPGMDGVELIQHLLPRRLIVPLIVASGREASLIQSVETMARNLGLPVLAGLQKPLTAAAICAAFARFRQETGTRSQVRVEPASAIHPAVLARAIGAGGIGVHYQPKVDMRTGIVRGVEALARWRRPGSGPVAPEVFVALAEREGLIHDLTFAVLAKALAQAADWNARGLKLSTAVNLSPRMLERPTLVDEVSALVAQHGLQAQQVVLEITESSVVDRTGAALGVLARLRLKGFGLSIDDYGTGFSSMQQLARIPFTELKIDRSFVHGAHQRANLRVILQSALDMARRLDLVTVAEGIETIEDWRLLQECGCSIGQGYLIAKPMPAAELPAWLKRHQGAMAGLRADAAVSGAPWACAQ
jgi:EAL domain-containing protein (putative c-di-GMP-specific phosphodiesterase class I)/FixJ family two-component response regulator